MTQSYQLEADTKPEKKHERADMRFGSPGVVTRFSC